MAQIEARVEGCAGWITLDRPKALNALTHDMSLAVERMLETWRDDDAVALVILDAAGERAFCAGGDLVTLHDTGRARDFAFGRRFWRDEYRMNALVARYPKPVVSFLHGFVMGGGVGVGCHCSHRIVCASSRIAMPECGIGLVPDVGGSLILARAPGRLGEYLGMTGTRAGPGDAILAGFADHYVPEEAWPALKARLAQRGEAGLVGDHAIEPPRGALEERRALIDRHFGAPTPTAILESLAGDDTPFASEAREALSRASPLSLACTLEMIRHLRGGATIEGALDLEYRFTSRSMEHGDFLEGIRALIVDCDRTPHWRHDHVATVTPQDVAFMLAPVNQIRD